MGADRPRPYPRSLGRFRTVTSDRPRPSPVLVIRPSSFAPLSPGKTDPDTNKRISEGKLTTYDGPTFRTLETNDDPGPD